jgi:hypothetical protein
MMSNLVKEQQESNKLLRKLVGGDNDDARSNQNSIISGCISPVKGKENSDSKVSVPQKDNSLLVE